MPSPLQDPDVPFGCGVPRPGSSSAGDGEIQSEDRSGQAPSVGRSPKSASRRPSPTTLARESLALLRPPSRLSGSLASGALRRAGELLRKAAPDHAWDGGQPSPHLLPGAEALGAALERSRDETSVGQAELVAIRHHWSEPAADPLARAAVALERGAAVMMITSPTQGALLRPGLDGLEEAFGAGSIVSLQDPGSDVVRFLAGDPAIELDLLAPDDFSRGTERLLRTIRAEGQSVRAQEGSLDDETPPDWFGAGVVDAPTAPLRVRVLRGINLTVAKDEDPRSAAERIALAAYGVDVLGGYATGAAARVTVAPALFSRLTEELLDVLSFGFEAGNDVGPGSDDRLGNLGPPPWVSSGPSDQLDDAIVAGRRIGLDEGATLIHEQRRPGERAVLFTNVERRMRLGGSLRIPTMLALLRG